LYHFFLEVFLFLVLKSSNCIHASNHAYLPPEFKNKGVRNWIIYSIGHVTKCCAENKLHGIECNMVLGDFIYLYSLLPLSFCQSYEKPWFTSECYLVVFLQIFYCSFITTAGIVPFWTDLLAFCSYVTVMAQTERMTGEAGECTSHGEFKFNLKNC